MTVDEIGRFDDIRYEACLESETATWTNCADKWAYDWRKEQRTEDGTKQSETLREGCKC